MSDVSHIGSSLSTLPSRVRSASTSTNGSRFLRSQHFSQAHMLHPEAVSGLEEVIRLLQATNLPGPMVMISDKKIIGQGGQFVVYSQVKAEPRGDESFHYDVAVKQPKLDLDLTKPRLDLGGKQARRHLDNILVEVQALTTPFLQRHENIVRLLSWSYDRLNFHNPISLVLELASADFAQLLSGDFGNVHWYQRYVLCGQVASGIDAIHKCNMVHGDLKPQNVLMFWDAENGYTVKLADFGLSIVGLGIDRAKERLGGTEGWQAPEVVTDQLLGPEDLIRCDNYSFGLLAWSTIFGDGKPPSQASLQNRESLLRAETHKLMQEAAPREVLILRGIAPAILSLLQQEGEKRPKEVEWNMFDKALFCCAAHQEFEQSCT